MVDPKDRRRRPRIRTLTDEEHAAACAAWALKYPEPLGSDEIKRTMSLRQKMAIILASDITKVAAGALASAAVVGLFAFFLWQVPTTLYAIQRIKDVQGLSTVVEDNKALHLKLDARLDADEKEQQDNRVAVAEVKVVVDELKKSQDKNFSLLFRRLDGK